jgi:hypothetical protein
MGDTLSISKCEWEEKCLNYDLFDLMMDCNFLRSQIVPLRKSTKFEITTCDLKIRETKKVKIDE